MSDALFTRKLKTFTSRMQSTISIDVAEMEQNPMYPDDPTKQIPTGSTVSTEYKIRLIRSSSSAEGYTEGSTGFKPDDYKWILSLKPIAESSSFELHNECYITDKCEKLIYRDKVYGYRSSINVRNS